MEPLGIISGIILLQGKGIFQNLKEKEIATEYGKALVFLSDAIAFIPRHGKTPKHHILPHLINNQANLRALKDIGVKEVISVNSTGSLKKKLKPGTIVVPDDFNENILHPLRDLLALLDRVPDVLPGHFHAAGLESVRHPDDVADFVREPVSSLGNVKSHNDPLPALKRHLYDPRVTQWFLRAVCRRPVEIRERFLR